MIIWAQLLKEMQTDLWLHIIQLVWLLFSFRLHVE